MKITFIASINGIKKYGENYFTIINYLTSQGHTVNHVLTVTEKICSNWCQKNRDEFFLLFYKKIKESDIVIADCTFPSTQVGYEISYAIHEEKEVIILRSEAADKSLAMFDSLSFDKNLYIYEYTKQTLIQTLKEILQCNAPQKYKKFNVLFSPQLVAKLNSIAKKKNLPKSVYIRQLIEKNLALDELE